MFATALATPKAANHHKAEVEMDARSTRPDDALAVLEERVARLPTKGFWVSVTVIQVAVVSSVIIFKEELQAVMGI